MKNEKFYKKIYKRKKIKWLLITLGVTLIGFQYFFSCQNQMDLISPIEPLNFKTENTFINNGEVFFKGLRVKIPEGVPKNIGDFNYLDFKNLIKKNNTAISNFNAIENGQNLNIDLIQNYYKTNFVNRYPDISNIQEADIPLIKQVFPDINLNNFETNSETIIQFYENLRIYETVLNFDQFVNNNTLVEMSNNLKKNSFNSAPINEVDPIPSNPSPITLTCQGYSDLSYTEDEKIKSVFYYLIFHANRVLRFDTKDKFLEIKNVCNTYFPDSRSDLRNAKRHAFLTILIARNITKIYNSINNAKEKAIGIAKAWEVFNNTNLHSLMDIHNDIAGADFFSNNAEIFSVNTLNKNVRLVGNPGYIEISNSVNGFDFQICPINGITYENCKQCLFNKIEENLVYICN